MRADGGDAGWCALRAASVAGVRHRTGGTGPEDAYAWSAGGGAVVLAVADGLGAVDGSAAAAAAAVLAAVSGADPGVAVAGAGGATTLVTAHVCDDGRATLGRVGDSSGFVLRSGVWWEVFADPEDRDRVGTATAALPADAPGTQQAGLRLEVGDVLVLVSDGVAGPLRDGPTTVAPGLAAALAVPPDPLELLRVTDFSRQGCFDDRTVLALWFRGDDAVRDDGRSR